MFNKRKFFRVVTTLALVFGGGFAFSSEAQAAYSFSNITSTSATISYVAYPTHGASTDSWQCLVYNNPATMVVGNYQNLSATVTHFTATGLSPNTSYDVECNDQTTLAVYDVSNEVFTTLASDPTVTDLAVPGVTAPVRGATPVTSVSDTQYTGTVSWNGSPTTFAPTTTYTATIVLTANTGYSLTGVGTFTVAGASTVSQNAGTSGGHPIETITATFPATQAIPSPTIVSPTASQVVTGTVGTPFNFSFSMTGTAPFTVTASAALPNGLTMTTGGVITGTPTTAGTTTLNFTVQDALGGAAASVNNVSFIISAANLAVAVPDPVQMSKTLSLSPATTTANQAVSAVITGNFVEKIRNISLNGKLLALGTWTQSATAVTINIPALSAGSAYIQLFNGSAPVMDSLLLKVTPALATSATISNNSTKQIYIQCVKGSHTRISFGVNPTCPQGYNRK